MSIKINKDNYDTYKKVYTIIAQRHWQDLKGILPESVNPILIMENIELKNMSIAKKALQAGLNDSLSSLKEYPKETLAEIDFKLKEENLPDLSVLLGTITKTISKVLKTKKIGDIDQYYIIKEILDDTTSEISVDDRVNLSKYLNDFEIKTTNG